MKYQIYVLWPSLISVDVTGLPCPTHAHMAYDHSIQEIAKEKKVSKKEKFSKLLCFELHSLGFFYFLQQHFLSG